MTINSENTPKKATKQGSGRGETSGKPGNSPKKNTFSNPLQDSKVRRKKV
jgi:hypothetical protein